MKKCILVDLDGTLFDIGDRSPYDAHLCGTDTLNPAVAEVARWAWYFGIHVILMSGRGFRENDRYYTEQALFWNGIQYEDLFMRPVGDKQKDYILKEALYREHIEGKYEVLFVMDDRGSVVRMWRSLGLRVFQVDDRID